MHQKLKIASKVATSPLVYIHEKEKTVLQVAVKIKCKQT